MFKKLSNSSSVQLVKAVHATGCRFFSTNTNESTVDGKEVSHFKKYTSTWWDEMGTMKPLHSMNRLRIPFIRDSLINSKTAKEACIDTPFPLKDLRILDVGCGGGLLTEPLARLGCSITGIDVTNELIEVAKEHAAQEDLPNLNYVTCSVEEHAAKNKEVYDAVVASEVIEHVNDKSRFVCECVSCLKPRGSIFFTTINKTFMAQMGVVLIPEYVVKLIPIGTHDYDKFVKPHVLQRLLEDDNCTTKVVHGMFYNYFTNDWKWMKDTSISYALHAMKL